MRFWLIIAAMTVALVILWSFVGQAFIQNSAGVGLALAAFILGALGAAAYARWRKSRT